MGARRRRRSGRKGRQVLVLLLLALVAAGAGWALSQRGDLVPLPPVVTPPPANGTLRVHVLDVGQGDATLWELPDGSVVLYDCGPPVADAASSPVVRYLRDNLSRPPGSRLHALVASHGHLDHVGGCEEVLSEYSFAHVYDVGYEGADAPASYRRFQNQTRDDGAQLHTMPFGGMVLLPDNASVQARILWPASYDGDWDGIAEASIVVRLAHGESSFCFQGDIESAQERALAKAEGDLSCDFYLVGHHGSRYASDAGWLAKMQPRLAAVSFGENDYGHPTSEALCRVQQAGAALYATHRNGAIVVESDGAQLRVTRGAPETLDYCAAGASYWTTS